MELKQNLVQRQEMQLKQILSPMMIQMMKTFQQPYSELIQSIYTASNENVCIEITQDDQLASYSAGRYRTSVSENEPKRDIADISSDLIHSETLYEHLMSQLNLENLNEKDIKIAEQIIEAINDDGYIENYNELKQEIMDSFEVADRKVNDILKIVQTFEPDGVGARSLKECLLIQIDNHQFENEKLEQLLKKAVTDCLDELKEKKYEKAAKKLEIDVQGIQAVAEFIKQNLTPNPGGEFSSQSKTDYIIPSFEVSIVANTIHLVNLEEKKGIKIGISEKYERLLKDPNSDEKTKDYLKEKYRKAKEFVESIQRRYENLQELVSFIVQKQYKFVEKGPLYLVPLLQKEAAEHLDISSSTVSRIVSSKYIQTPHGLFSLKQLCPRSHFGKTSVQMKLLIQDLMTKNPSASDEQIKEILKKDNIYIARRTIAKYREDLGIVSSYLRKNINLTFGISIFE
ncbi:RNA polymerase factor sigma-54 [Thermoproteota archaeon]